MGPGSRGVCRSARFACLYRMAGAASRRTRGGARRSAEAVPLQTETLGADALQPAVAEIAPSDSAHNGRPDENTDYVRAARERLAVEKAESTALLLSRADELVAAQRAKGPRSQAADIDRLRARRDERLWDAACWRDHMLDVAQRVHRAEMDALAPEAQRPVSGRELVSALQAQRKRVLDDMRAAGLFEEGDDAVADTSALAALVSQGTQNEDEDPARQRKGRGRTRESEDPRLALPATSIAGPGPRRRNQQVIGASGCVVTTTLHDAELAEDLARIVPEGARRNGRGHPGHRRRPRTDADAPLAPVLPVDTFSPATVGESVIVTVDPDDAGVLRVNGSALRTGDVVVVSTPDGTEMAGTLADLGARDLWIDVDDGARLRITHKQLRTGTYAVRAL